MWPFTSLERQVLGAWQRRRSNASQHSGPFVDTTECERALQDDDAKHARFHFSRTHGPPDMTWCVTTDDYDGPGSPKGLGPTRAAAMADLLQQLADLEK